MVSSAKFLIASVVSRKIWRMDSAILSPAFLGGESCSIKRYKVTLLAEVAAWQSRRDQVYAQVNWQFATNDVRIKLKRLYPTFDEWHDTSSSGEKNKQSEF